MNEEFGNEKRFRSGVRKWQINKKAEHQGVVVDFEKKELSYNAKNYWIRFETQDKLYIYNMMEGAKA